MQWFLTCMYSVVSILKLITDSSIKIVFPPRIFLKNQREQAWRNVFLSTCFKNSDLHAREASLSQTECVQNVPRKFVMLSCSLYGVFKVWICCLLFEYLYSMLYSMSSIPTYVHVALVATTNIQRLKEIPETDEIHMENRNHGLAWTEPNTGI